MIKIVHEGWKISRTIGEISWDIRQILLEIHEVIKKNWRSRLA
jgi:hypothetical protein